MPKKSNSVTKSQRIQSLRKILSRWGRLNKEQIDIHLSNQLDVDRESISRTVYRDLEELVTNHEVETYYFSRDGILIDEYDSSVHKNTYCEWALVGCGSQIIGQDILKDNGALLLASDRLHKKIKVVPGNADFEAKTIHLFFNIPNHFLCLKIAEDALPVIICIGRISAMDQNSNKLFKEVEAHHGKRSVMLSLPYSSVSSFKTKQNEFGHALIKIENEQGAVVVVDQNSKNKTYLCKLSQIEADNIRKQGVEGNRKTLTDGSLKAKRTEQHFKNIEVDVACNMVRPLLVFLSEQVPVLVV